MAETEQKIDFTDVSIEVRRLGDLRPYKRNPRRNDAAVPDVANSIQDFRYKNLILVDKDNNIIAGHTRYKAIKSLGYGPDTLIKVQVADDFTPQEAEAYRIADNSTATKSEWDDELLQEILVDIGDAYNMADFGLDLGQYIEGSEFPDGIEDDEPPAPPRTAVTKPGEIIRLGDHVLLCGDATKPGDMRRLLQAAGTDDGAVDMVMTDPPYNVAIEGETAEHLTIDNDDMDDGIFKEFLESAFSIMRDALKAGGPFYIWHASMKSHIFREACEDAGLPVKQFLQWVKAHFVLGHADYQWKHEPCIYGWKDGANRYFIPRRDLTTVEEDRIDIDALTESEAKDILRKMLEGTPADVIHDKKPAASRDHPTMKPVTLLARLIFNSSHPGDTVLDPFGGSGSTMMACEQLHRRCIMMELDPVYCDVIVKRWEALTGRQAQREGIA